MDQQVFSLIMERFDRLDEQGKQTQSLLSKHVEEDTAVHKIVDHHVTYWSITKWCIASVVTIVLAWFGLK